MRLGALLISMNACGRAAAQDYQPVFDARQTHDVRLVDTAQVLR